MPWHPCHITLPPLQIGLLLIYFLLLITIIKFVWNLTFVFDEIRLGWWCFGAGLCANFVKDNELAKLVCVVPSNVLAKFYIQIWREKNKILKFV